MNLLDIVATLTLDSSQYDRELNRAISDASSLDTGFARSAGRIGRAWATIGGVIVGNAGLSVKAAADYESAFTGVMKTINVDEFEGNQEAIDEFFDTLYNEMLLMTREMPVTAEQIANIGEVAGQLGINNSSLLEFIRTMVMMGSATNLSAEEAATALARFANVSQMNQDDFDKLGSTIVALGNNTATSESEIVYFMQDLANLSRTAGLSESDIAALAATMSATGARANTTRTTFENLASIINDAVAEGGAKLELLAKTSGMTAEEFSNSWRNKPMDALLAFIAGLDQLNYETNEQEKVLKKLGVTQTLRQQTLKRAAGANKTLAESVKLANAAYKENGESLEDANDLQIEYIKRAGTLESKWQLFKNSLKEVAINAGEALIPALKNLLDALTPIINSVADFIKENPEVVQQITEIGLALVGIGTATSAISRINSLLNRTTLIVTGIIAIVTVLLLYKDEIREFFSLISGRLESLPLQFQNIRDIFENLDWGQLARFVGISIVAGIADGINAGIGMIEDALTNIVLAFNNWVDGTIFSGLQIDLGEDMKVNLPQIDTSGLHEQAVEAQRGILRNGARERIDARNAQMDELYQKDVAAAAEFHKLFTGEREVKSFEERLNDSFIGKIFSGLLGNGNATEEINAVTESYDNLFNTLEAGVQAQEQQTQIPLPEPVPEETTASWKEFADAVTDTITEQDFSEESNNVGAQIVTDIGTGIQETIPSLTEEGKTTGKSIMFGVDSGMQENMELLNASSAQAGIEIMMGIQPTVDSSYQWGSDMMLNFIGGIESQNGALEETVAGIAGMVNSYLGFSEPKLGPLSNFHTYAPDMMELFAKGIRDNSKMLANTVTEAFDFTKSIETSKVNPSMSGLSSTNYGGFTFNVYGSQGMNEQTLARLVSNQVRDQVVSLGAIA